MKFLPTVESLKSVSRYLVLGLTVFTIGLVWNFPYERLATLLTRSLTRSTGYQFAMDSLSPALPFGVSAQGVRISGPPIGGRPVDLQFDTVRVTSNPFSALFYPIRKKGLLAFSAVQRETTWKGRLAYGKERTEITLGSEDIRIERSVSLADVNPMLGADPLKLRARLKFTLHLSGPTTSIVRGDLSTADGDTEIEVTSLAVDPPLLEELRFDKISLSGQLQQGALQIKSLQLTGPDLSGTIAGSIRLSAYWPQSQLDLKAQLQISESATDLRSKFPLLGASSGLQMNSQGGVSFALTGPMSMPQLQPL